jgi:AcrR family transcriptional regulator
VVQVSKAKEDSRERFLIAAERLFVERGYKGTTIRAICSEANTSLAILNRNWPSKEALFAEMLRRHFDPLHAVQDKALLALAVDSGTPSLGRVIDAFFKPAFSGISTSQAQRTSIYSRALIDPSHEIKQIVAHLIADTRARLIDLVGRSLPHLDRQQLFLTMNIVFGAYIYPQAFGHQLAMAMDVDDSGFDWNAGADRIVATLCAGLASHQA